jgi:hypothetical protein
VISRITHILVFFALIAAAQSVCFAAMRTGPVWHASKKMPDCCCNQQTDVPEQVPAPDSAVLLQDLKIAGSEQVVSVYDVAIPFAPPVLLSILRNDLNAPLWSPPNLYVLHASFRI